METTDMTTASENTNDTVQDVGTALRTAREGMGLSVMDIAERIKFAPKQVEALEANDFAKLPQATFLRGFVRSYARVLHLDEEQLLAALPGAAPANQKAAAARPASNVTFSATEEQSRLNMMWLGGALGIAIILGVLALMDNGEPVAKKDSVVVEPVTLPASAPAAAQTEEEAAKASAANIEAAKPKVETPTPVVVKKPDPVQKPVVVQKPESVATPVQKPIAAKPVETKPVETKPAVAAAVDAASAPVAAKPVVPLELLKRRPMHFVFTVDAWAEVIDVNGTILLSRTNPAGSEQWIGGPRRAPYSVKIARPGTVKLYYKGKEIDLSAYAGKEIANLTVE